MTERRKVITFKLDDESHQWINDFAKKTGKQKTEIMKAALTIYRLEQSKQTHLP